MHSRHVLTTKSQKTRPGADSRRRVRTSRDFPRVCTMLAQIKPRRPDFVCFTGTEEILYPTLMMDAGGDTIAASGVIPEGIAKLYRDCLAGNHDECRRVQLGSGRNPQPDHKSRRERKIHGFSQVLARSV